MIEKIGMSFSQNFLSTLFLIWPGFCETLPEPIQRRKKFLRWDLLPVPALVEQLAVLAVLLRINSTSTSGSQGQWPDSSFSSSHCFSYYSTSSLVPKPTCCFSKSDGDLVYSNPNPPPPRKKYSEHTHDSVCPFIQSLMLSEGQSIKDIRSILDRPVSPSWD